MDTPQITFSYHTKTDSEIVYAIQDVLESNGCRGVYLPYLGVKAIRITSPPEDFDGRAFDAWTHHFMSEVGSSIGLITISTPESTDSENSPDRGMFIERRLIESLVPEHPEFVFRLEHPVVVQREQYCAEPIASMKLKPASEELIELRAQYENLNKFEAILPKGALDKRDEICIKIEKLEAKRRIVQPPVKLPELEVSSYEWIDRSSESLLIWVEQRIKNPIRIGSRFDSSIHNIPQEINLHEVGRALRSNYWWYVLCALDLYDCIWYCKNCFASSDVWMRTQSRPPDRCPGCGYAGMRASSA